MSRSSQTPGTCLPFVLYYYELDLFENPSLAVPQENTPRCLERTDSTVPCCSHYIPCSLHAPPATSLLPVLPASTALSWARTFVQGASAPRMFPSTTPSYPAHRWLMPMHPSSLNSPGTSFDLYPSPYVPIALYLLFSLGYTLCLGFFLDAPTRTHSSGQRVYICVQHYCCTSSIMHAAGACLLNSYKSMSFGFFVCLFVFI